MSKRDPSEGDPYCPVHRFELYKAIRACPALTPGAKIAWECLVERTWKEQTGLIYSHNQLASDIGLGFDQAKRYVRQLVNAGLLRTSPRYGEGHQKANQIDFLWRDPEDIQAGRLGLKGRKRGGLRIAKKRRPRAKKNGTPGAL